MRPRNEKGLDQQRGGVRVPVGREQQGQRPGERKSTVAWGSWKEGRQKLVTNEAAEAGRDLCMEGHPKKSHLHRSLMT